MESGQDQGEIMPTKLPRLNVTLEPGLYDAIQALAKKTGISTSLFARDLLAEALELHEDSHWKNVSEDRRNSLKLKKTISDEEVWQS